MSEIKYDWSALNKYNKEYRRRHPEKTFANVIMAARNKLAGYGLSVDPMGNLIYKGAVIDRKQIEAMFKAGEIQ